MKLNIEIEYSKLSTLLNICQDNGIKINQAVNDALTIYAFVQENKGRRIEIDECGMISVCIPSRINNEINDDYYEKSSD